MNSYRGNFHSDQGSFSTPSAEKLDKDHQFCTKHKTEGLFSACKGLGKKEQSHFISDVYALIYKFKYEDELDAKFEQCFEQYSQHEPAIKYITGIQNEKEKLCRVYTQRKFSWNHTSTQRSEKYNDSYKGHRSLQSQLSHADLFMVHRRVEHVGAPVYLKAKKMLKELRRDEKRWSKIYEKEVRKSMELASTRVIDCCDRGNGKYDVTDVYGKVHTVDLASKVVHRGIVYSIPACKCGYWLSSWRICYHIVPALTKSGQEVFVVTNIHPIHLIELHPLFKLACHELRREGYNDFPQHKNNEHLLNQKECRRPGHGHGDGAIEVYVCPNKFFNQFGKMPKQPKRRVAMIQELCADVVKLASDGDENAFRHAHARLLQLKNELRGETGLATGTGEVPIVQPPEVVRKSRRDKKTQDSTNNSFMCRKGTASTSHGTNIATKYCPQCYVLNGNGFHVQFNDHSVGECIRTEQYVGLIDVLNGAGKEIDADVKLKAAV